MLLKEAAGWNQTVEDWERLLELDPDGCFAVEQDGAVEATATAIAYGRDLAWVGMVLTSPRCRGRGFASRLVERALKHIESRGIACAGLDATELGIGVYERFGFVPQCMVERWVRLAAAMAEPPADEVGPWELDAGLDHAAFSADRARLLRSLARAGAASVPGRGYAMGRPGSKAAYFGPCVAASTETAGRLLRWFLATHADAAGPVYWDLPADNREAASLARRYGFEPARRLTRMFRAMHPRAAPPPSSTELVFAIAGFEFG